jgi:hypothetical protein
VDVNISSKILEKKLKVVSTLHFFKVTIILILPIAVLVQSNSSPECYLSKFDMLTKHRYCRSIKKNKEIFCSH